jgi:hypothetical protein
MAWLRSRPRLASGSPPLWPVGCASGPLDVHPRDDRNLVRVARQGQFVNRHKTQILAYDIKLLVATIRGYLSPLLHHLSI